MKKVLLLLSLIILAATFSYAQSAKQMLAEISGHWELDDNRNVTVVRVIDAPDVNKNEIFNRALNYFTYNYGDGRSTIQTQDRDNGLIVGKGVFENIHTSFLSLQVDAWHVLRIDAKDGRARLIISLTNFDKIGPSDDLAPSYTTIKVADSYPVNPKGGQKTVMTKAFYNAYHKAFDTLEDMEKAIKNGNTSNDIENKEW